MMLQCWRSWTVWLLLVLGLCPAAKLVRCQPVCSGSQEDCVFPMIFNEDTCMCECPDISCEDSGMIQNPNTCFCECPPFDPPCVLPMIVDPDTCECRCPNAFCIGGQEQNLQTCECECPMCPLGQEPTDPDSDIPNCTCRCSDDCGPGRQQNPNTCECQCIPLMCGTDKLQDPETCECVCIPTDCPDGQTQDPQTCQCECNRTNCGPGRVQDLDTCSCVCQKKKCPYGFVQSPRTCQCVCDLTNLDRCNSQQFLRLDTCECECILYFLGLATCHLPGVFDHNSCQCFVCVCDDESTRSRSSRTGTRRTEPCDPTLISSTSGPLMPGEGSDSDTPDSLETGRTTPHRTSQGVSSRSRTRSRPRTTVCSCDSDSTIRPSGTTRTTRRSHGSRSTKTSRRRSSKKTRRRTRRTETQTQMRRIT